MNDGKKTIITINNIHKVFGGIYALSDVSFDLKEGEIHALCGENGAGKSTLIKVITGAYTPDEGSIEVGGQSYRGFHPAVARGLGISAVYQEFNLLQDLSVAENIFLTNSPMGKFGLIDVAERSRTALKLLERLGAAEAIDPNELVKNLTVGEQQIVEIAKALAIDAHILIMDEPSAVLPSREMDRLYEVVKTLRNEGRGIIYISHRLNEIFELADRVTVLKDGKTMGTRNIADTNYDELVHMMVGRELTDMYPPADTTLGDILLEIKDLCIENTTFNINFNIREGEILGLAGLGGSGRTTIARALVGLAKINSGEIYYLGQESHMSPARASNAGVVLVPEDRKSFGLILDQSIRFNITLPNLRQVERWRMIFKRHESGPVITAMADLDVRPSKPELEAGSLSGGNQQKVVLAKWMMARPKVIVMDEPTRGIDVGAKAEIYALMRDFVGQGGAIVMASSELPELLGMSDRILVMHEGRMAGELSRKDASEEEIMLLATATKKPVVSA